MGEYENLFRSQLGLYDPAMVPSAFRYEIVHIPRQQNDWAYLLSRWGAYELQRSAAVIATLFTAPIAPDLDPYFKWPSGCEKIESKLGANRSKSTEMEESLEYNEIGLKVNRERAIWIPDEDTKLQLRSFIIGHCGRDGRRGADTTYRNIKDFFLGFNEVGYFCFL